MRGGASERIFFFYSKRSKYILRFLLNMKSVNKPGTTIAVLFLGQHPSTEYMKMRYHKKFGILIKFGVLPEVLSAVGTTWMNLHLWKINQFFIFQRRVLNFYKQINKDELRKYHLKNINKKIYLYNQKR